MRGLDLDKVFRRAWVAWCLFGQYGWEVTPRLRRTPCYQAGCDEGWLKAKGYQELCRCSLYVIHPKEKPND